MKSERYKGVSGESRRGTHECVLYQDILYTFFYHRERWQDREFGFESLIERSFGMTEACQGRALFGRGLRTLERVSSCQHRQGAFRSHLQTGALRHKV